MFRQSRAIYWLASGLIAASLVVFALLYLGSDPAGQAQLRSDFATGLLQVAVLGVLAAAVKFVLEAHAQEQAHEAALRQTRVQVLNQLTEGYFAVKKALHVIDAYRTAEVYGEQVRSIIDQRYVFQRISNEAQGHLYEFEDAELTRFTDHLKALDAPLSE